MPRWIATTKPGRILCDATRFCPRARTGAGSRVMSSGPMQWWKRAAGDLEVATKHFNDAVRIFHRYTLPWEEAETLHLWGRALVRAGEAAHASEKFDAAIEILCRRSAGQCWIDRTVAEQARIELPPAATPLSDQRPPDNECLFRREGEYWTVGYGGVTCRLKDMKGLGYIAHLIAHPGHRIHVLDLFAQVGGSGAAPNPSADLHAEDLEIVSDPGDASEVVDSRARAEYRQRLSELHAELEEAERNNDIGCAERTRNELDSLTDGSEARLVWRTEPALHGGERACARHGQQEHPGEPRADPAEPPRAGRSPEHLHSHRLLLRLPARPRTPAVLADLAPPFPPRRHPILASHNCHPRFPA